MIDRVLKDNGTAYVAKIKRAPKTIARRVSEHRERRRRGEFVCSTVITAEFVGELMARGYLTGIEANDPKSVSEAFDDFIRHSFARST